MKELWISAVGFEGYEVSSHGNIRSVDRVETNSLGKTRRLKGREIKQQISSSGYANVYLRGATIRAHRLIAASFLGDCVGREVNHKNGVRSDNRIENLEICTRSENQTHACRVLGNKPFQPCKGKFGADHHRSKPVAAVHMTTKVERVFAGIHEAQRLTGLDKSNISAACRGKQKTCGGYAWRFI